MSVTPDPWQGLAATTAARIALGRSGASLPTSAALAFAMAHARARDAVHAALDGAKLHAELGALGLATIDVRSAAGSREAFLVRPDLGRRLEPASAAILGERRSGPVDVALVIADGLSAHAVQNHAAAMVASLLPGFSREGWTLAPVVVAHQGRVALGDEIGEILGARLVLMLIGERPGLSSPDSLGLYLTFAPRLGRHDGERNCISNVRGGGLAYEVAAFKALWLMREALRRGLTGVALKDESDALPADAAATALPTP